MGARIATYTFIPKENEQIDASICLEEEPRSMIHGVVRDWKGRLIKDAVVKLFRAKCMDDPCELKPIAHAFTDDCGQFMFGPLQPGKKYVIKVWAMELKPCKPKEQDTCKEVCEDKDEYTPREKEASVKNKPLVNVSESHDAYYYKN